MKLFDTLCNRFYVVQIGGLIPFFGKIVIGMTEDCRLGFVISCCVFQFI